jgi:choline kinase
MGELQDDFIFLHADTIFEESILRDLINFDGDIVLPVDFKQCIEEEMRVTTSDNKLLEISKNIPINSSEGEFIGLAKIGKSKIPDLVTAVVYELKENSKHQDYFEAALQNLVNHGIQIDVFSVSGRSWIEIDFEEDFVTAKALFDRS